MTTRRPENQNMITRTAWKPKCG